MSTGCYQEGNEIAHQEASRTRKGKTHSKSCSKENSAIVNPKSQILWTVHIAHQAAPSGLGTQRPIRNRRLGRCELCRRPPWALRMLSSPVRRGSSGSLPGLPKGVKIWADRSPTTRPSILELARTTSRFTQSFETGQWATSNRGPHTRNRPRTFCNLGKTCESQDDLLGRCPRISQNITDLVPAYPSDNLPR